MKILEFLLPAACFGLMFSGSLGAKPQSLPMPDFTKGESVPEEATKDWNLGATGARGWMHTNRGGTFEARQVLITKVAAVRCKAPEPVI